jgi:hypothetical protein
MARASGTDSRGGAFSQETIKKVWEKATIVPGFDKNVRRKDHCGAWIDYKEYGKTVDNGFGWEIDHIKPVVNNGTDADSNLQPLQWQNNRHKSDNYPASSKDCLVFAKSE